MEGRVPLPPLFMRSVIMAIKGAPKLRPFVGELMSRLISKQIWLNTAQVECGEGGGKGQGQGEEAAITPRRWDAGKGAGVGGAGAGRGNSLNTAQVGREGQGLGQETSAQPHPDQVMVERDAGQRSCSSVLKTEKWHFGCYGRQSASKGCAGDLGRDTCSSCPCPPPLSPTRFYPYLWQRFLSAANFCTACPHNALLLLL